MLLATAPVVNPQIPDFLAPLAEITEWALPLGTFLGVLWVLIMGFKIIFRVYGIGGMPTRTYKEEVSVTSPSKPMLRAEKAMSNSAEAAEAKGREDMIAGWITWALHARAGITNDAATAEQIRSALDVVPHRNWDTNRLQAYGRNLWELRNAAKRAGMGDALWRNLFIAAAWADDRRDDRFDTMAGITDQRFLLHEDPAKREKLREAYIAGGLKGVDEITRALQLGRERIDDEIRADATRAAAVKASNAQLRSVAEERNARLAALRETYQPTAARDAHAAWEKQAKELDQ